MNCIQRLEAEPSGGAFLNKTLFYTEKLRKRALLLIAEYSSFSFYLCFAQVFKAPDLCFDMVLPRTYNYNLTNI